MSTLCSLSDADLVARLPLLVQAERHAMADVIEHLVEVERRRLYLSQAMSSLYRYCIDQLGYSEDAALKRHRVATLALRLPRVLDELRAGSLHLTALFLLSKHLTEDNASALLAETRGKSRRQVEELIARRFPRPDVLPSVTLLAGPGSTCPGTGQPDDRARLEPLSPGRVWVEFTAGAEFGDKLEKARQLLSHAIPGGDLAQIMERALDALLEKETRRRFGAGKPRKRRKLQEGSRHIPVEVRRAVWERDGGQCTFVDTEGRRCTARSYLTFEHQDPHACGGPPTTDNLCLLCSAHNAASAREVFGEEHIETKIRSRRQVAADKPVGSEARAEPRSAENKPAGDTLEELSSVAAPSVPASAPSAPTSRNVAAQVLSTLCSMGFKRKEATEAIGRVVSSEPGLGLEPLLRKCLPLLVPAAA
jgi:5-methylcytosine-specific restriction endonuclease McrA